MKRRGNGKRETGRAGSGQCRGFGDKAMKSVNEYTGHGARGIREGSEGMDSDRGLGAVYTGGVRGE